MAYEEHRSTFASRNILHLADGFLLELGVADGEDFVHHQDLGIKVRSHSEAQTNGHTATITLNWRVDILLAARECDDLVQLGSDLLLGHTHDGTVHKDVLTTRHLRVKACTDLQEAGDAAPCTDSAHRRACDLTEEFEQGTLASAVLADDADYVALLDLEVDIAERPDVVGVGFRGAVVDRADLEVGILAAEDGGLPPAVEVVADSACGHEAQAVLFAYVVEFDCCCHMFIFLLAPSPFGQKSY